ncbi:hypothetical protein QCA50_003605 [Cerrena zonata]|uniref:WD40 repeat-like protein n=1 Tax=Cerrena zonata TaxID=2478898 RepID=A0AAW0GWQ5_9APHY
MQKVGGSPIVAIACSPFSKTLIAVACSGGSIGLVDLDKEKGLFRTLSLRTPLSSVSFSPEGASIYAGTENGKILILDLRALDKPPKTITVSQAGERIVCVAVQRKLKPGETTAKSSLVKPLSQQDVNKTPARRGPAAPSVEKRTLVAKPTKPSIAVTPPRSRVTSAASTPAKPRSTSATTLTSTPKPAIRMRTISTTGISSPATRSVSTPARPSTAVGRIGTARKTSKTSDAGKDENVKPNDKLDVPVSINDLLDLPGKRKENVAPKVDSGLGRIRKTSMTSRISSGQSTRPRTISTTSRTSTSSRTVSGTSASGLSSTTARTSPSLKNKHSYEAVSPIPPVPKLPAAFHEEQLTSIRFSSSRTPSPDDLSLPENIPITPLPKRKDKGKSKEVISGMNLLGLGTPEVRRWVEVGDEEKTNGRKVGFAESKFLWHPVRVPVSTVTQETGETETHFQEAKIELTVQISPRRPLPQAKATSSWAAVPSPLRGTNASSVNDADDPTGAAHSGPSINNPAHDLLQSLVKDALYDFRRETKAEIIGLHLDLVRMGRGWRKEMREAMEEWSKELNEVREENKRLRHENDRLKRGY